MVECSVSAPARAHADASHALVAATPPPPLRQACSSMAAKHKRVPLMKTRP
jgi:hypothetical protein